MKYDHPEVIDPALAVIEQYDPALHQQMLASDWSVHLVTDLAHDPARLTDEVDDEKALLSADDGTVGLTNIAMPGRPTDISMAAAIDAAAMDEVSSLPKYLAYVLVHEYVHHVEGKPREDTAYHAGSVFARKMGEGLIEEDSEQGEMLAAMQRLFSLIGQ